MHPGLKRISISLPCGLRMYQKGTTWTLWDSQGEAVPLLEDLEPPSGGAVHARGAPEVSGALKNDRSCILESIPLRVQVIK